MNGFYCEFVFFPPFSFDLTNIKALLSIFILHGSQRNHKQSPIIRFENYIYGKNAKQNQAGMLFKCNISFAKR